jgi:hypothetical protein
LLECQLEDLQLVVANRFSLVLEEGDQEFEYFRVKLLAQAKDVQILVEDEDQLTPFDLFQDGRLGEGVDKELLGIGLQGEELGKDVNLLEEDEAVFVVALAAVPQELQAQVSYLLDKQGVHFDVLLLIEQLSRKPFHYFNRPLNLQHLLLRIPDIFLENPGVDLV